MAGLHKSPYHGFSVEFAEHRQYMPGDDLKHLDWKVYARTEKFFIKQYEEETNLKSYILLDISKSMTYSSLSESDRGAKKSAKKGTEIKKGMSKLKYASYIAASLAYLMRLQRDAVSLITYDTKMRKYIPPSSKVATLKLILSELARIKSEDKTGTAQSLNQAADKIKKRGLVIILSDLFDNQEEVIKALRHFRYDKNEVIVFQILDPVETAFMKGGPMTLVDIETKEELFALPSDIQKSYAEALKEFIGNYRSFCISNGIDYELLTTETPFDISLLRYISKRKKSY